MAAKETKINQCSERAVATVLQYANQLKKFRRCKGKEPAFKVLHNNFVYNSILLLCNTISEGISYYTIKRLHSFSCVVYQEFCEKAKLATSRVEEGVEKEDTTEWLVVYDQRVTVKEVSVSSFECLEPFKVPFVLINATVCALYI